MARKFNNLTLEMLKALKTSGGSLEVKNLHARLAPGQPYKEFYNACFRLSSLGLAEKAKAAGGLTLRLSEEGQKFLARSLPERDGVWKIVIFDIPEKQKKIRAILRAKLKQLGFKKWRNSIWISPFALDREITEELAGLSKKFFVRLIKSSDINVTEDLEKLFA